jgi:hypothetical protein
MNIIIKPEFKDLIPALSEVELDQLHRSLDAYGCQSPLLVWEENQTLVDGHNRYEYCSANGIPFEVKYMDFSSEDAAKNWMILNQLGRRNLDPDTASMLRGKLYNGQKKEHGGQIPGTRMDQNDTSSTAETIAKQTGVSAPTVKRDGKFAQALEKLGLSIADFKASGKSKKDVVAEAFPPKAKKAKPAPVVTKKPEPEPEVDDEPEDSRSLSECIVIDDEDDETPEPTKPPQELDPWTIMLMQAPKVTKAQRQEFHDLLETRWDCKPRQS